MMDATRQMQMAIVRVDIAIVAAWHVLRIAVPVAVALGIVAWTYRRLRQGRRLPWQR